MVAAETTTTSRSEDEPARGAFGLRARARRFAVAALAVALAAAGCHRRSPGPTPEPSAAAALPPVPEPDRLLLRGAIRHPADVYQELVTLVGGRARFLPTSLAVAIATTAFDSPLSAGLVDDGAPVALAVLDEDAETASTVAALRLTSGRELVASLTTGSDAKFVAQKDGSGVVLLTPRGAGPSAELGVYGDHLLIGESKTALLAAGPFLARTVAPAIDEGSDLELTASRRALAGALARRLRGRFAGLRDAWLAADSAARKARGGRSPDFGDPTAVVRMATAFSEGIASVLGSAASVRLTATLAGDAPFLRAELLPDAEGAAHELTQSLDVGRLDLLLSLPAWVEAAAYSRGASSAVAGALAAPVGSLARPATSAVPAAVVGSSPFADRLEQVLGERLPSRDRLHVRTWLDDVRMAVGPERVAGLFDGGGVGLFVMGTAGDGDALRRATLALPAMADTEAFAAPLHALVGRLDFARSVPKGGRDVTELTLHISGSPGTARSARTSLSIMSGAAGRRAAAVAAVADPSDELAELLAPGGARTLSEDEALRSAVSRAGAQATAALLVRVRGENVGPSCAVLTVGSDRNVTWAEVGASKAALGMLVRASVAR